MKCVKKKHDYTQLFETLFWHALYCVVMWVWYRNVFFRCFEKLSLTESRILLFSIVLSSTLLGFVLDKIGFKIDNYTRKKENYPFINMLIGFGTYAALTYVKIKPLLVVISISASILLAIAYSLWIMCRKVSGTNNKREIKNRRIHRVISNSKFIVGLAYGVILAVIGVPMIFGGYLVRPSVHAAKVANSTEWTVNNNIEELALFFDDEEWSKATLTTKLNTCQIMANICQSEWGTNELNVVTSNTSDILAGYYDDSEHLIMINVDYLMTAPGPDICNTVIHEAYHALEHRMVDAYLAAPDDMKDLELYHDAAVYKREFEDYQECSDSDYYVYANQLCEKHARFWADCVTYDIENAVNEYKTGQS